MTGRLIDVKHLARERVIGCFELDGVLVDPGPTSCVEALLAGLSGRRPRALLLTHIHLDHAGASGSLVERYPELEVYVHARGAPHLLDPAKLLENDGDLPRNHEGLARSGGGRQFVSRRLVQRRFAVPLRNRFG